MNAELQDCVGCGSTGEYTILLAESSSIGSDDVRYFIPNQHAREEHGSPLDPVRQVTFCKECTRAIENNLRGTIADLQRTHGVKAVRWADR